MLTTHVAMNSPDKIKYLLTQLQAIVTIVFSFAIFNLHKTLYYFHMYHFNNLLKIAYSVLSLLKGELGKLRQNQ